MEAALDSSTLKVALIVLVAAGVVIPLFHRLRISAVVGFMLVGAAVGPYSLGRFAEHVPWLSAIAVEDPAAIAPVARFGVVFLMFMIGLELSFERLRTMRRLVFGLGAAQLAGSTAVLAVALRLSGLAAAPAAVLAMAGAMSSTAIVVQVLAEQKRLTAPSGRAAFAVLLFQDLSVVPILFALGLLGEHPDGGTGLGHLGVVAVQALAAVGGVVAVGRLALRPLLRSVARTQSPDLFMAASLLVVLACALATEAAGVSMALGALIGGLLLAGTEFRRQVEVTIEPFKGLLVGVFLISVGMGVDFLRVAAAPGMILGAAAGLVLLQLAIIAPLARAFGIGWAGALEAALLLAPAGEFSFVLLSVAVAVQLLPPALADTALAAAALTMAAIPLLALLARPLRRAATPRAFDPMLAEPVPPAEVPRVVIAGFGRVGQTVAALLDAHQVPYVALDRDPDRVARQRAAGRPVYWGDMTHTPLLRRLELPNARALVVTLDDGAAADELVAAARAERADLLIVARARDARHAAHLYRVGASDAVPEAIEASLQLAEAVLVDVGIPMGPVIASIHEKREEIQKSIKAMAPEAEVRRLGRGRLRDLRRAEPVRRV